MVIKSTFLICLFLGINIICYSQNLNIQLEVELSHESIYLKKNKIRYKVNVPFLLITYKNHDNNNIYFKKIVKDCEVISFPGKEDIFVMSHAIQALKMGQESIKINTHPSDIEFFVDISNPRQEFFLKDSRSLYSLNVFQIQTVNWKKVSPMFFNQIGLLKEILNFQYSLNKFDSDKQLIFFDYPTKKVIPFLQVDGNVIMEKDINLPCTNNGCTFPIEQFKNQFIFLKKNEECTQRINILPFLLMGGTYNLSLANHKFKNYIKIYDDSIPDFREFKLPDTFQNYNLYTGEFKTDSSHIIFNNKKGFIILGDEK